MKNDFLQEHPFVIMWTLSSLVATEVVVVTTGASLDKEQNDIFTRYADAHEGEWYVQFIMHPSYALSVKASLSNRRVLIVDSKVGIMIITPLSFLM